MKKETERCSQAELARRWGISRTMVGKYAEQGLKAGDDGKYSWAEADRWRKNNVLSHRSGSFKSRARATEMAKRDTPAAASSPAEYKFFSDGVHAGYFRAWEGIRSSVPELLSNMFPGSDGIERIAVLALTDFLLQEWFSAWREAYPEEPCAIDWSVFKAGITPADAERTFVNFQKIFAERAAQGAAL